MDSEEGFLVRDIESGTALITKSFPELVNSSDDGARLLWLEFRGPGGEEELDMGKNPKVEGGRMTGV